MHWGRARKFDGWLQGTPFSGVALNARGCIITLYSDPRVAAEVREVRYNYLQLPFAALAPTHEALSPPAHGLKEASRGMSGPRPRPVLHRVHNGGMAGSCGDRCCPFPSGAGTPYTDESRAFRTYASCSRILSGIVRGSCLSTASRHPSSQHEQSSPSNSAVSKWQL